MSSPVSSDVDNWTHKDQDKDQLFTDDDQDKHLTYKDLQLVTKN